MKKRIFMRFKPLRLICALLIAVLLLLFCGLTAFAAESTPDIPQTTSPACLPPYPEDMRNELFPADVQTVIVDGMRQIIKTYILTADQSPTDIPRESFERDGWRYTLTDVTEKRINGTDKRNHTETVTINTDSKDLNVILKELSQTMDYQSNDGYCGVLSLDIASVKYDAAGYKNTSYTVTATREYPNLSNNDLSYIPKSITDNGQTLQLDDVKWEVQHYVNVDYDEIPELYRAVAKYTGTATKSVVTGYVTTAEYSGEITKNVKGDTIYAAYFSGREINPIPSTTETTKAPEPTETTEPIDTSDMSDPTESTDIPPTEEIPKQGVNGLPLIQILTVLAVLAAFAGAVLFYINRRNVKIYRDKFSVLAAKDKIDAKNPVIDLSPLEGQHFGIEIEKFTAKTLNGKSVEIRQGSASLSHKIAYEGNAYRIEVDFDAGTIQAIY